MSPRLIKPPYLVHFENNHDQRGLLSPIQGQHYQQQSRQITPQLVIITMFSKATSHEETSQNKFSSEGHGGGGLELVKLAREAASRHSALCIPENTPVIMPVRHFLWAPVGRLDSCLPVAAIWTWPKCRVPFSSTRALVGLVAGCTFHAENEMQGFSSESSRTGRSHEQQVTVTLGRRTWTK